MSLRGVDEDLLSRFATPQEHMGYVNQHATELNRREQFDVAEKFRKLQFELEEKRLREREEERRLGIFDARDELEKTLQDRKREQQKAKDFEGKRDAFVKDAVDMVKKYIQWSASTGITGRPFVWIMSSRSTENRYSDFIVYDLDGALDWHAFDHHGEFREAVLSECEKALRSLGYAVSVSWENPLDSCLGSSIRLADLDWGIKAYENLKNANASKGSTGLTGHCAVCMDDDAALKILMPCSHTFCNDCCGNLIGKPCPMCRQNVNSAHAIFLSK